VRPVFGEHLLITLSGWQTEILYLPRI